MSAVLTEDAPVMEQVEDGKFMVIAPSWRANQYALHLDMRRGILVEECAQRALQHQVKARHNGFHLAELHRVPVVAPGLATIRDIEDVVLRGEYYLIPESMMQAACLGIVSHMVPEGYRAEALHAGRAEYLRAMIHYWPAWCERIIVMHEPVWIDDVPRRMCFWKTEGQIRLNAGGANGVCDAATTIFAFAAHGRR